MSETPPPKRKRKSLTSAVLRQTPLLQEAERSPLTEEDVGWISEEMQGRELWLVQLPRDVCLAIQLPLSNGSLMIIAEFCYSPVGRYNLVVIFLQSYRLNKKVCNIIVPAEKKPGIRKEAFLVE